MMNKPKNYDDDFDNIFFGRNKTEDQILEDLKKQEQPKHIFVTEGIELKDNIKDLVPMSQNQKKKHNKVRILGLNLLISINNILYDDIFDI